MYAILKTGGKQYKVSEGDVIYVEKLGLEADAAYTFNEVLAIGEGDGGGAGVMGIDGQGGLIAVPVRGLLQGDDALVADVVVN